MKLPLKSPGSYDCSCINGYFEDAASGLCVDIDECVLGIDNCDTDNGASCTNTEGSFACSCPENFGGAGTISDPCTGGLKFVDFNPCGVPSNNPVRGPRR